MRSVLLMVRLSLLLVFVPFAAAAQSWLNSPFDARTLSREDTATIQAALSWSGDFSGSANAVWGEDSQKAFASYTQRIRGSSQPLFSDIKDLVIFLEDERVAQNWQINYSAIANTSYLYPFAYMDPVEGKNQEEYISKDQALSLIIREGDASAMQEDHDWFLGKAAAGKTPFTYRSEGMWISWVELENKMTAYVRSDFNQGKWTSMNFVSTNDGYFRLNLLASSTLTGQDSPLSLIWTEGGVIDQVINGAGSAAPVAVASALPRAEDQVSRPGKPSLPAAEAPASPFAPKAPAGTDPGTPFAPDEPVPETLPEPPGELVEVVPGPNAGEKPAGPILGVPAAGAAPALPSVADAGNGGGGGNAVTAPAPGGLGIASGPAPIRSPDGANPATPEQPGTAPAAGVPRPKVTGTLMGSGTGFYIAPTTLVTAAHVIEGCSAVGMADGTALEILAADPSLDVAVLGGAADAGNAWLKLSALEVPKLGEAVTVLGYPYSTSLDQGLTVTSGNVSALRGVDGSSNRVMITAPVQPGNSGGPLLNKKGAVIGVVVSRVDDIAILQETGTLPQNMNFAVPSGPLLTFLRQKRIPPMQGNGVGGELGAELPAGYSEAVVPVNCYR